jgi:hypothetical protein
MKLKVTASWTISSLVKRHGVTTTSRNENNNPWSGNIRIPHQGISSKCKASVGKVMCTVFWDRKGIILLAFLEPRQTINSDLYIVTLSWRPEFPESGHRRRQHFSCNMILTGLIPVWRPGVRCEDWPDCPTTQTWYRSGEFWLSSVGPMKDGLCGKHFPDKNTVITAAGKNA